MGDGGGQARREGVDARTPAPLALNATIDRRLELFVFSFLFLSGRFLGKNLMYVHAIPSVMKNKALSVCIEFWVRV